MGIYCTVHSPRATPIEFTALAEAALRRGWHLAEPRNTSGALGYQGAIYGAALREKLDLMRALYDEGRSEEAEEVIDRGEAAWCELHFVAAVGPEPDRIESLEEDCPAAARLARAARSRYHIRNHGSSLGTLEFMGVIWRSVGDVAGGLLEDDEGPEWVACEGGQVERLGGFEFVREDLDPMLWERAASAGLPARRGELNLSEFSLTQLECLLEVIEASVRDYRVPTICRLVMDAWIAEAENGLGPNQLLQWKERERRYSGKWPVRISPPRKL